VKVAHQEWWNDRTVHLTQGDLMLCDACELDRFPYLATGQRSALAGPKASTASKSLTIEHGNSKSKPVEQSEQSDAATALPSVFTEHHLSVLVSGFDESRSLKTIICNELLA